MIAIDHTPEQMQQTQHMAQEDQAMQELRDMQEVQQMEEMQEQPMASNMVTSYHSMINRLTPMMPWGQTGEEVMPASRVDASPMPTVEETFHNSWKGMLSRNLGREMIVTFLVGSQDTVVAQGTLYEVGNDYIGLYHAGRDSYITADIYSVRFVEINPSETGEAPN